MALFTGKGDSGTTKLFDSPSGVRVSKSAPVFEALGQLDELNATIGWCRVSVPSGFDVCGKELSELLAGVQDKLFTLQAEVAGAERSVPEEAPVRLGELVNAIESELPPVSSFLVLGGTEVSARFDIARAISRRAERRLVTLHESGERSISAHSRAYANRLSSLFYALARLTNHRAGASERPPRYS